MELRNGLWQEHQRCDGARRKRPGRKDAPGQEVIIILARPIICGRLIRTAVARVAIVVTDGYWTSQSHVAMEGVAGVGLAGILSGTAWSAGRRGLAVLARGRHCRKALELSRLPSA